MSVAVNYWRIGPTGSSKKREILSAVSGMKIIGSTELETRDLGDSLQFVRSRNPGWLETVLGTIALFGFAVYACYENSIILMISAAIVIIGASANLAHGRETLMRVSEKGVMARGNLDSWLTTELSVAVEEITSVGWSPGGEGDNGGVYVSRGFAQMWVLPGATEEQGRAIIAAIEKKFPDFPIADRTAASLLFGNNSGITTLDLAKSEKRSAGQNE